jgi:Fe-S-cluster containining protein
MQFIPWQYIFDWRCNACGRCCKDYSVVINFPEWLSIVKNYGVDKTVSGLSKLFIKRRSDGSCIFLQDLPNVHLCGLQCMKPKACKLWPFKILSKPEFGYANEASYQYDGKELFIYTDSSCNGVRYGRPSWKFANQTLREFVEIALELRRQQFKTTANVNLFQF